MLVPNHSESACPGHGIRVESGSLSKYLWQSFEIFMAVFRNIYGDEGSRPAVVRQPQGTTRALTLAMTRTAPLPTRSPRPAGRTAHQPARSPGSVGGDDEGGGGGEDQGGGGGGGESSGDEGGRSTTNGTTQNALFSS